ncbi:C40 family peptidase [Deinococcus lacus]|uniref:C40 family peptidase n=1 Tax=Deinococcus lacus TaxID=392561 RepID=A0ABW1Y8W5_9DEIO
MNVLRSFLLTAAFLGSTALAGSYTVRGGDTLYRIAQAHGMSTQQLMELNGLQNTNIEVGQALTVSGTPKASGPVAASGGVSVRTAASRYLGLRYRLGATGGGAVDCSSYTQLVFRNLGISIPRTAAGQWRTGSPVSSRNLREGDLVFFNTTGRGVSHVGIYVGGGQMANANSYYGRSMIEPLFSNPYWASRYMGARRVLR